jgi:hypothetical protein
MADANRNSVPTRPSHSSSAKKKNNFPPRWSVLLVVSAASGRGPGSGAGASPDGRALSTLVGQSSVSIGTSSQPGTGCSVTAFVRLDLQWGQASKFNILNWANCQRGWSNRTRSPRPRLVCRLSCRVGTPGRSFSFSRPSLHACRCCFGPARLVLTRRILRYPVSPRSRHIGRLCSCRCRVSQTPLSSRPRDAAPGLSRRQLSQPPPTVTVRTRPIGALPVARRGDNELPNRARARTGTRTKP